MEILKTYNVLLPPTESSPEGQYFVKTTLEHWVVSNGKAVKIAKNSEKEINEMAVKKSISGVIIVDESYAWIDGERINVPYDDAVIVNDAISRRTDFIPCDGISELVIQSGQGIGVVYFSDNTEISWRTRVGYTNAGDYSIVYDYKAQVPNGAKYLIINSRKDAIGEFYAKASGNLLLLEPNRIKNLNSGNVNWRESQSVKGILDEFYTKKTGRLVFVDKFYPFIQNSRVFSGQFFSDVNVWRTDFINCETMRNIFVSNVRGAICCYFADKTLDSFISNYYPSDYENQDQTIPDPPENAKYVIFNYPQNTVMDNSNFKIIADGEFEIAKTFEPVVGDGRGFRWDVFGDSLSTDWYHGVETWNSKVQKKLKITDRRNYSEGGAVWTDNATGWQKFSEQVLQAISYNTQDNRIPDLITISLGTNNIVSDMSDYDAIMSIAWGADGSGISRSTVFGGMRWGFETLKRAYPLAVIIATTPLPRGDGDYSQQVIAMGDSIKKMAKAYGIIVVDAYAEAGWSEIIDKTIATDVDPIQMGNYWFYDKLHASEGGSEMMAKYMASKIMPFMI